MADRDMKRVVKDRYGKAAAKVRVDSDGCCAGECDPITAYDITPTDNGVTIEVTGVGDKQQQLLAAFGECRDGRCSCPTTEYEKVEAMELDVQPSDDAMAITLQAKPGTQFDTDQVAACLDYTLEQAGA